VRLVLKNILRNPVRTILTVLSVAGSFCMLGVLMAMYRMFFLAPPNPDQALRLIVRNRISYANSIPLSYEGRIQNIPGVRYVMKFQWFGGTYKDSRDPRNMFPRFAIDPDKVFLIHPEYSIDPGEVRVFRRERNSCVLGRTLAERLGLKAGDHVTIVGDIFRVTVDLVVRGFYDAARDNESLFFHYDYLNEAAFHGRGNGISMFYVMVNTPEDAAPVARAIDAMFRNSPERTKTETEKGLMLGFLGFIGNVKLFLTALCSALTLATLFIAANTMAMSVRERTSEVGILKTLGFSRRFVLWIFLAEAVGIAVAGAALGFLMAAGIIRMLHKVPVILVDLKALSLAPELLVAALVLAAAVGFFSSIVPAWEASSRSIRDCLTTMD